MESSIPYLSQRIQALPLELQVNIFDFTIAFDPVNRKVDMSQDYRAPWQLQINRATRKKQAPVYFGTRIFHFDSHFTVVRILKSMTAQHRGMIATLRQDMDWPELDASPQSHSSIDLLMQGFLRQAYVSFEEAGVRIEYGPLQMNKLDNPVAGRATEWVSLKYSAGESSASYAEECRNLRNLVLRNEAANE